MLARGVTPCEHIRRFYCIQRPEEAVFYWEFESDGIIPEGAEFHREISDSGDPCHRLIRGITNQKAKDIAAGIQMASVLFCENGTTRVATPVDFADEFTDLTSLDP